MAYSFRLFNSKGYHYLIDEPLVQKKSGHSLGTYSKSRIYFYVSLVGLVGIISSICFTLYYAISSTHISAFLFYFAVFSGLLLLSAAKIYEFGFGYWYYSSRGYALTYNVQQITRVARTVYSYIFFCVLIAYLISYLMGY